MIIAIDGQSSTGKSTISYLLAKRLNFSYINSGLLYRAITHNILINEINLNNFKDFTENIELLTKEFVFDLKKINNNLSILKSSKISALGTEIAKFQFVREKVNFFISELILNENNIIIEGRDIGTNLIPNADFKFFFTADLDIRANRLALEMKSDKIDQMKLEIKKRDFEDENRKNSPLRKANDAVSIDTSYLTIEETINLIEQKLNE